MTPDIATLEVRAAITRGHIDVALDAGDRERFYRLARLLAATKDALAEAAALQLQPEAVA